jgi:hypothetical protein
MLGRDFVTIHFSVAELAIGSVQIEAVLAGDYREHLLEIRAEFLRSAGFARIIAGDGETATQFAFTSFESPNIVPLPAVEGNRNSGQGPKGSVHVDIEVGVALFSQCESLRDSLVHRGGPLLIV